MGEVFRAHDPVLDRDVAVKRISAGLDADDIVRKRFEREARSAANLNHPNIITVYELGVEGEQLFMAMELLNGIDLKLALSQRKMSLEDKLDVTEQICEGLAFAHAHDVVHRDLKPANIHLLPGGKVKIMDFGLARMSGSDMTSTGTVMGTPHYMSPEQVRGARPTRARTSSRSAASSTRCSPAASRSTRSRCTPCSSRSSRRSRRRSWTSCPASPRSSPRWWTRPWPRTRRSGSSRRGTCSARCVGRARPPPPAAATSARPTSTGRSPLRSRVTPRRPWSGRPPAAAGHVLPRPTGAGGPCSSGSPSRSPRWQAGAGPCAPGCSAARRRLPRPPGCRVSPRR